MEFSEFTKQYFKQFLKKLNKKYYSKGWSIYVPHRRTFNSALAILEDIHDIPFEKLTLELYFLISDKNFEKIANDYKRAIEIGKKQPEKFIFQLYEFYKKEARYIKDNNLSEKYFEFVSNLQAMAEEENDIEKRQVYRAYVQILLEQCMFMTKDNLNFNQIVIGIDTDGNIIEGTDLYPNLDIPVYEIEEASIKNRSMIDDDKVFGFFKKWGYDINSEEEAEELRIESQIFGNVVQYLIPFVNEYTIDILPEKPMSVRLGEYIDKIPLPLLTTDYSDLLQKRRRTLPTNGLVIEFSNSFYRKLLLKEVYRFGQVVLLYKLETWYGDIVGAYRTKDNLFYSNYTHATNNVNKLDDIIKEFVLWGYTSFVCDEEMLSLTTDCYQRFFNEHKTEVHFTQIGGKLKPASNKLVRHIIAGKEGYETQTKHINGYIRKLPDGQKASEKAIQLAKSLGYSLLPSETYVAPFERQSWFKVR